MDKAFYWYLAVLVLSIMFAIGSFRALHPSSLEYALHYQGLTPQK